MGQICSQAAPLPNHGALGHIPYPLHDVWQIKIDLGIFADNPDKYIEVFQGLKKFFDLAWGD